MFSSVPVVAEANERRIKAPMGVRSPCICGPAVKCGDNEYCTVVAFQAWGKRSIQ